MLLAAENYNEIKKTFNTEFRKVLDEYSEFKVFMYDVFLHGSAYVVGGFLRNIINKQPYRDLDIIIDLQHDLLLDKLNQYNLFCEINRHGGIKLKLDSFYIDIWSIENNWAFKNNLVKQNDEYILENIATGSFYNFDALVINVHTKNLNVKYYNEFVKNRELDILQRKESYKVLNPTIEANILRAFYLKKLYDIKFSDNTVDYLKRRLLYLDDNYQNHINRLIEVKAKYEKYSNVLNESILIEYCTELLNSAKDNNLKLKM